MSWVNRCTTHSRCHQLVSATTDQTLQSDTHSLSPPPQSTFHSAQKLKSCPFLEGATSSPSPSPTPSPPPSSLQLPPRTRTSPSSQRHRHQHLRRRAREHQLRQRK